MNKSDAGETRMDERGLTRLNPCAMKWMEWMEWMVEDKHGDRLAIEGALITLGEDFLRDVYSYRDFSDSVRVAMTTAAEEKARAEREARLKAEDEEKRADERRKQEEREEREKEKGKKQKMLSKKQQALSDISRISHSTSNNNTNNDNEIQSSGERKRCLYAVDQEILSVTLYFPAQREQPMIVNVGENTTWRELFDLCLRVVTIDDSERDNVTLTHIAHPPWPANALPLRMTTKIDDTLLFSKTLVFPYLSRTERERNIFELRHVSLSNIGGCFSVSMLAESEGRFNRFMREKVEELEKKHGFGAYREIRGDGNCYFRAVLYGALEQVVESPRRVVLLREWHRLFEGIVFPKQTAKDVLQRHDRLLFALNEAIEGRLWPTAQHLEKDFIPSDSQIDLAFVCACKHAVSSFILQNRSTEFNGISLEDSIGAFLTDDQSLEQYCEREVLAMGECAEGAHVYLGVLPALLWFCCEIAMLYADATPIVVQKCAELFISNEQSKRQRERERDVRESLPVISLLFRPGHYDLLYRSSQPSSRKEKSEHPLEIVTGLGNDYEKEKENPQVERNDKKLYAISSRSSLTEAKSGEKKQRHSPVDERLNENRLKVKQESGNSTRLDMPKQAPVVDYSQSAQVSLSAYDPASAAELSPTSLRSASPASTRRSGADQFSRTGSTSVLNARTSLLALAQTQSWGDIASETDVDNKSNNNTSSNHSRIAPSAEFTSPRISHSAVAVSDGREERSRSRVKERPSISSPIPRKGEEPQMNPTLLFVNASIDKAEEKMAPIVNEALSEPQLRDIHHRFYDPLEVDNYRFLVSEMGLPSPLVLDAMITYDNRCLITIMVVVKLLRDRKDFSPSKHSGFTAKSAKNESVKSLCRQCLQMNIPVEHIIYALSEDDVLTVEDLLDSIEVRDRRANKQQHQRPLNGSRDFFLEAEIDRRVCAKKYGIHSPLSSPFLLSDEEVREEVAMMGRNQIIVLLNKSFLYDFRYDKLSKTKDLRKKLLSNLKFRSY